MKKSVHGFMLIECITYCLMVALVVASALQWATTSHTYWSNHNRKCLAYLSLQAAHDYIIRDIRSSLTCSMHWKEQKDNLIIWSAGEHDVGWQCKDDQLVRLEGQYNQRTQAWATVTYSLVAQGVRTVKIEQDSQQGSLVVCALEGDGYYEQRYAIPRNGVKV